MMTLVIKYFRYLFNGIKIYFILSMAIIYNPLDPKQNFDLEEAENKEKG